MRNLAGGKQMQLVLERWKQGAICGLAMQTSNENAKWHRHEHNVLYHATPALCDA